MQGVDSVEHTESSTNSDPLFPFPNIGVYSIWTMHPYGIAVWREKERTRTNGNDEL